MVLLELLLGGTHASALPTLSCQSLFASPDEPDIVQTKFGRVRLTDETAIALLKDQREIAAALKLSGKERKEALQRYFKQNTKSRVQTAFVFANYVMAMVIGSRLVVDLAGGDPSVALTAAALMPATLFLSDLISGIFFHKFLDSFASEKNPLWGNAARAFRKHHEFPGNLNELGYIQNIAAFGKLLAPLYVATMIAQPHISPEIGAQALLMLMLFSNGTEIHRQAHLSKPDAWAKPFQKGKIFIDRETHTLHHKSPTDSDYGIVNGWSNRVTRPIGRMLDMLMWKAMRRMPHNWIQNPRSIPDSVVVDLVNDIRHLPQQLIVSASNPKDADPRIDELIKLWIEHFADMEGTSSDVSVDVSGVIVSDGFGEQ